jgi:hypothetical protein
MLLTTMTTIEKSRRILLAVFTAAFAVVAFGAFSRAIGGEHNGKVLLAGDGQLTIKGSDGANKVFKVSTDAKIARDGKSAKLEDLKLGDEATVSADEKMVATAVKAKSAATESDKSSAAAGTYRGTLVSVSKGKLKFQEPDGASEKSLTVAAAPKVSRDGKEAKLEDLQKGDAVKLTTATNGLEEEVIAVEATSKKKE